MALGDKNFERINDNLRKMFKGGATREQIDRYVAAEGVTAAEIKGFNVKKEAPLTGGEKVQALGERALTGATLGLSGAISPAIGAVMGEVGERFLGFPEKTFKQRFQEERQEFKERQRKLSEERPKTAIATEILGGLVTGAPVLRGLSAVGRVGARAVAPKLATALARKGALPAVGRAAGTGFGFGGTYGGGTATSEVLAGEKPITEIPKRALSSAFLGMLAGGGLSGAGQILGAVGKPLVRQFGRKRAIKSLAERAGREQLEKSVAQQKPLLDIGDKRIIDIAERASAVSDSGKDIVINRAIKQLEAQPQRLVSKIDDVFSAKTSLQNLDELTTKFAPLKKELYDKAYKSPIDTTKAESINKLKSILKRDIFKDASKELKDAAKVTGEIIPENLSDINNTQNLDLLKRGIDTLIDKETERVTGALSNKGRLLVGLRKEFVNLIDDINPNYKLARKVASDEYGLKDAMREAKKIFKKRPEQIKKEFEGLADAEKEAYLIGVKDELLDKISKAATSKERSVAESVFKFSEDFRLRQQLEPILGKENFGKFMSFIDDEIRKGRTFKSVLSIGKRARAEELTMPKRIKGAVDAGFRAYDALTGKFVERKRADIARMLVEPEFLGRQLQTITPQQKRGLAQQLFDLRRGITKGQPARSLGQVIGTRIGGE